MARYMVEVPMPKLDTSTKAIMAQRQWPEAELELRQIVAAEDQVRGPEHWDTMIVRHSLALAVLANITA